MILGCGFGIEFRRKAYKQHNLDDVLAVLETPEIIESVENYCPCVMKAKVAHFVKLNKINFKRSRAPSPESIMTEYSEDVSSGDESEQTKMRPEEIG